MKKTFLFLSAVLVSVFMLTLSVGAVDCERFSGDNISAQNYNRWASPVESYLICQSSDKFMRVQYLPSDGRVLAEYYDSSYNLLSRKYIQQELPLFGGFYADSDAFYILSGKANPNENNGAEVFRITKYDKNWNRLSSAGLYGVNTTIPFNAGSARFAQSGKYIIIRTCHEMYKSDDGFNHQANVTIQLDSEKMQITDYFTDVMNTSYGYVSHSFNQFVAVDNDKIVSLDHGDAYPRSIVLIKYKTNVSSGKFVPTTYYNTCQAVDMFPISGRIGDNTTNCSVGGFQISSSSYIAAMSSVEQGSSSDVRNIYISVLDKNSGNPAVKKLTNYTDTKDIPSTPHLVKIDVDNFVVIWKKGTLVYLCELDGKGNIKGNIHSFEAELSDCVPVFVSGKIVWYVWENNEVTFFDVALSMPDKLNKTVINSYHDFQIKSASGTTVNLLCKKCNAIKTGSVPSNFCLWWEIEDDEGYYSSEPETKYHPGAEVNLWARYTSADYNEYEIISSDSNVIKIIYDSYGNPVAQMLNEGTAKITIRSKYSTDAKKQYTIEVAHLWSESQKDATCIKSGEKIKRCSYCGESEIVIIPPLGHNMSSYVVTKQPTCTAQGKKVATCSRCGEEASETIEMLPHDKKTSVKATSATCTKSGKTEGKKCSMCGKVTVEQETIPALGHDMGEYKVTKQPTCTAQGKKVATCSRCGEEASEAIEKIAHDKKTSVKATSATCTKSGKTEGKKCSMCGKVTVEQETIPALGHDMGEYKVTKQPTCTAQGKKVATCSRCGEEASEAIEKIAHDKKTSVKATSATCTKSGKTEGKKCSMCGKVTVEQETIPALGHDIGEYKVTKQPTCTAQGKKVATCSRCGEEASEAIEKIAHDKKTSVKATSATCTKSGKTEGKKCSMCGKVTVEQETIPVLGHDIGEYKVTKQPTCTAQGKKVATCSRCGEEASEAIEKIPHDENTSVKATSATCTKSGKTEGKKCSMCGKVTVEQETIPALGHDMGEYKVTKQPTCTAQGKKVATCSRCGEEASEAVEKIPHDENTSVRAVAATCTKSGKTEGKKCSMCGKVTVEQETIPALGHDMSDYKVTKQPTCTAQGEEKTQCSRCDSAETRNIPKLGHSYSEYEITKEATCTARGEKTAYCNRCNQTIKEVIPRKEHIEKIIPSVNPDCVKNGKTQGRKCTVCGKVLEEQKVVEKLGHNYKTTVVSKSTTENHGEVSKACVRCGDGETYRVYMIKNIKLTKERYAYNGKTPKVSVKVIDSQKNVLKEGTDYTVSVGGAKNVGTHTATIKFKGRYEGTKKLSFDIVPGRTTKITASQSTTYIKLTWGKVSGATGYRVYQYDSKTKNYKFLASVKGQNSYTAKNLNSGTTYKFAVKAYTKLSDGTVYWGTSVYASFTTKTEKLILTAVAGTKSAVLSWQEANGATGYQIYYSTSKNGEYKKLHSTKSLSYKKTGLTTGKTYYFKVRSYKKVDGKTFYGAFSNIKSVKVK